MRSIHTYVRIIVATLFAVAGAARLCAQQPFYHADPNAAKRQNLGENVNGPGVELLPLVSPDGKTLYFDRKYSVTNMGGLDDEDDIYYCTLDAGGKWSRARNIGAPLNTPGSDVLFWISLDGNTALVHNGAVVNGRTVGLAISHKEKDGNWSVPEQISIAGLENLTALGDGYSATISADGSRLILAYSRDTANSENLDLFSCPAIGNDYMHWGPPVSMGQVINTLQYEWAPYIAADNKTLYFASGGQLGFGHSDIFMSRRLDNSWEHWSDPYNLGPTINTADYETALSLSPKGDYAYLSAVAVGKEKGIGKTDIFRVLLPDSMRPEPMGEIRGKLNAGGEGVQGLIRVESVADGTEIASATSNEKGEFSFRLPPATYRVTGWAGGYDEVNKEISLSGKNSTVADVMLTLHKESEAGGTQPVGSNVHRDRPANSQQAPGAEVQRESGLVIDGFDLGSSELPKSASARLQGFLTDIRTLRAGEVVALEVVGHTDNVGDEGGNQGLSLQRAESIKKWLVDNGVDAGTVITLGKGESAPAVANGDDAARARNRRVEIRILATKRDTNPR